jgi:hypothetical protein
MVGNARALDNLVVEWLCWSVKYEHVHLLHGRTTVRSPQRGLPIVMETRVSRRSSFIALQNMVESSAIQQLLWIAVVLKSAFEAQLWRQPNAVLDLRLVDSRVVVVELACSRGGADSATDRASRFRPRDLS